jgi:ribosomal protein S27AE
MMVVVVINDIFAAESTCGVAQFCAFFKKAKLNCGKCADKK